MIGSRRAAFVVPLVLGMSAPACHTDVGTADTFYCEGGAACTPLVTFTPRLLSRPAAPFAAGLVFQGSEEIGDSLGLPRGPALDEAYYARADGCQGTVVLWVTLDWDMGTVAAGSRGLFDIAGITVSLDAAIKGLVVESPVFGRASFPSVAADFKPGEQHLVIVRWDALRALGDGGQHVAITVDDVTQLAVATSFAPPTPAEVGAAGAADSQGTRPLLGSIAGLTVFRRPLFDGLTGVDLGRGNEIEVIYNEGRGADPVNVAGLWDVLLAVPTNGSRGVVDPLKRHAWALDRAASPLGAVGAVPAPGGWATAGATLAAAPDAEAVYRRALQVGSNGVEITATAVMPAGASYVVRALVHAEAGVQPVLIVRSNGTELGRTPSQRASSRQNPEELIATGALAPGETDLQVAFTSTGTGNYFVHEVLVYDNLAVNPSFEAWADTGRYAPVGWGYGDLYATEMTQETAIVHSGVSSLRIASADSGSGLDCVSQEDLTTQDGAFVAAGGLFYWLSDQAPGITITNGQLVQELAPGEKLAVTGVAQDVGWQHLVGAGRINESAENAWFRYVMWGGPIYYQNTAVIVDDAYLVPLPPFAVEFRAATFEQSLDQGRVRIDGGDIVQQPATGLAADRGKVRLRMALPRACDGMAWVLGIWGDLENEIHVVREAGAWIVSGYLDKEPFGLALASPALSPGVEYELTVAYDVDAGVSLDVDGQRQLDTSMQGRKLAFAPIFLAFGRSSDGRGSCDIELRMPGAAILTP